jgi:hypothetical protein
LLCFGVVFSLAGCWNAREKEYYSDERNFITGDAIIENIILDEDSGSIYLWLSEYDDAYQDSTFKIEGQSAAYLFESGTLEKIEIGTTITFASAPRYFGDGYRMPIVAITYRGETLLSFEMGHRNLGTILRIPVMVGTIVQRANSQNFVVSFCAPISSPCTYPIFFIIRLVTEPKSALCTFKIKPFATPVVASIR